MRIKKVHKRSILLFLGDIAIIPVSYLAGHYLRFGNFNELSAKVPSLYLVFITLSYLGVFYFFGLYEIEKRSFSVNFFIKIILGIIVSSIFASFLIYGLFLLPIGRGIFVLANLFIFILVLGSRIICNQLSRFLIRTKRVIIIGSGPAGQEIARLIKSEPQGFEIVGFVDKNRDEEGEVVSNAAIKRLGSPNQILEICKSFEIDQIILAVSDEENSQFGRDLLLARLQGVEVVEMLDVYQSLGRRVPIKFIQETWFLKAKGFDWSEKSIMMRAKRFMDILFSFLILMLSLPLWPVIALLIKINSKGPVIYSQNRVGKNDSVFSLMKFRSMIDKAEKDKPRWADKDDSRVTFVGRILRLLHLDELPQLINVLKGEMSLVGPRPERPEFVEKLKAEIPYYSLRHFLKPGLTGWAQVNQSYVFSVEGSLKKLEYDLYYIYNMTLLLDLRIILKTAQNIVLRRQV